MERPIEILTSLCHYHISLHPHDQLSNQEVSGPFQYELKRQIKITIMYIIAIYRFSKSFNWYTLNYERNSILLRAFFKYTLLKYDLSMHFDNLELEFPKESNPIAHYKKNVISLFRSLTQFNRFFPNNY